jgi:hypothetical protein
MTSIRPFSEDVKHQKSNPRAATAPHTIRGTIPAKMEKTHPMMRRKTRNLLDQGNAVRAEDGWSCIV